MEESDGFRFIWVVCCCGEAFLRLGTCLLSGFSGRFLPLARIRTASIDRAAERRDLILLCLALSMTVIADYNMVLHRNNIQGLYCFLAVQLLYFIRMGRGLRALAAQILAAGGLIAAVLLRDIAPGKIGVLAILYFTLFAGNLFWEIFGRRGRDRVFLAGLALFFLCDIHVGLMNLGAFVELPGVYWRLVQPYSQRALWFFYLPSQALISMSSCHVHDGRHVCQSHFHEHG